MSGSPAALAGDTSGFPDYAETEYEQSVITIPLYTAADPGNPVEILKLTAFMRLEREKPVRNGLGHRQFEFTIADWELYGYSEYLDAHVTFSLSNVDVQPKSLGVSLTEKSDYPAMIVYSAIYDVFIDGKRIAHNRPGVAFAKNVFEVPPRNITVAFTKPFSFNWSRSTEQDAETFLGEEIIFDDGTCEDMIQIARPEWEEGVAMTRAIRRGDLSLRERN
ncbi:MAG: hypothetical protein AAFX85_00020 [Pseudomonadota bacterium]